MRRADSTDQHSGRTGPTDAPAPSSKRERMLVDEIAQLEQRGRLIDALTKAAQKRKDDSWKRVADQRRRLNEIVVAKKRELRELRGEPEPEDVTVRVKPAAPSARAHRPGRV